MTTKAGYTPPSLLRCGNINPLRAGEVFDLLPGAFRRIEGSIPSVPGVKRGSCRLRLIYVNDSALNWQGFPSARTMGDAARP